MAGGGTRGGQRFGRVTGRHRSATEPVCDVGGHLVRDGETGITYSFSGTVALVDPGDWSGDCIWHELGLRWLPVPARGDLGGTVALSDRVIIRQENLSSAPAP